VKTNPPRKLTKEERAAIRTLKRLAKRWPKSLMLFGCDGVLHAIDKSGYLQGERQVAFASISGICYDSGTGLDTLKG